MKLAVLSDIHGNLDALEAVLEDMAHEHVDGAVALGDFVSGPFDPKGVARRLMDLGFPSVRGNHDRFVTEGREQDWIIDALAREELGPTEHAWLSAIPAHDVVFGAVFLCHGTPRDDNRLWMDGVDDKGAMFHRSQGFIEREAEGFDYPVLLCGHSHIPRALRLGDGRLIVNPGSIGLPIALGSTDARYGIIERRQGQWRASLKSVPYDHRAAAVRALQNGYPNWAEAVATGWPAAGSL